MASLCNLSSSKPKGWLLFKYLEKTIDVYPQTYDKFLLIGDFNEGDTDHAYHNFCFSMMQKYCLSKNML